MVQMQNERAYFFITPAAVNLNQLLDRFSRFIFSGVVDLHFLFEGLVGQEPRFALVEHGGLRVEAEFVKMFAHELEAKAMQRADMRTIEERELRGPVRFVRLAANFFLNPFAEPLTHFSRGSLGEGDNEQFVERGAFAGQAVEATLDERARFARAGAGHDQHVTARRDGAALRRRQAVVILDGRFHDAHAG